MNKFYAGSKRYFIIVLSILVLNSCKKDKDQNTIQHVDTEYFVDLKQASALGIDFSNKLHAATISENSSNKKLLSDSRESASSVNSEKIVENITPVEGSNGQSAYYIINYKEGGFTIISADKRTMSIMAFSETGKFKTDGVPEGLNQWLYAAKIVVDSVRVSNAKYTGQDTISRNSILMTANKLPPIDPDPDPCPLFFEEVGPLVETQWGQGYDGYGNYYNSNCPLLACGPNGHAHAGCTTVSVAQIFKYHQFPGSYNYSFMENNYSTNETERLMGNIFNYTINIGSDCDKSSGTMDQTVTTLHFFGYPGAHKINYYQTSNYENVKNELRANRPVIFSGGRKGNWLIFPVFRDGHQWVCDGFRSIQDCQSGSLFFHMNWGWYGDSDGWYGFQGFNPGVHDFNYKSEVIVGIHP